MFNIRGRIIAVILIISSSLCANKLKAQNYDLTQFKDFEQLAKVNPAFTGVLQKLRLLASNKGSDLNIALETKVLKTDNYLGGGFNQVSLDNVRRQTFYASYNRDKKLKNEAILKIAVQGDYVQKSFFRAADASLPFSFIDFDGRKYQFDSTTQDNYGAQRNYADLGLGLAYQGKRFMFGTNIRHLNQPTYSVNKDDKSKMPMEVNAQISSYVHLGKLNLIPTGMLSLQDKETYMQVGTGINYLDYTFIGQYERLNDLPMLDIGLTYRKGRIFAALAYTADLKRDDGIDLAKLNITINANLRKIKLEDKGILKYLSYLY